MEEHKKVGPIIATLVIVVVLVAAAVYLFASRVNQQAALKKQYEAELNTSTTTIIRTYTVQRINGTSTDPKSLQIDLDKATEGLDL